MYAYLSSRYTLGTNVYMMVNQIFSWRFIKHTYETLKILLGKGDYLAPVKGL